jgi:hypothetical protein
VAVANTEADVRYRRDVLPILSDRCFKCHGPDAASRQAGLRLDGADAATAELESGSHAIVPGDALKSALVERIESDDDSMKMPPADSGKTLSDFEKALLRKWVEQGAKYEAHWAFVAPVRPVVPVVKNSAFIKNPIDAFVIAPLESAGVEPSKQASRERLIRRLYFDLIGLPPSIEEIDAFVADESPDAYARLVDRLMISPNYGERMAADWLDGARFADSNGYQNDFARDMSPWRDWVIAAFNAHMPYDQFVTEQLAGDLLPNATLSQRIATGFNRNHRTVTEAGSIEEEWHVENVVDRVETASTVLLGLTVGCARCHDHKFDPVTQREFYQLFAFFNNVNEKGVYTETRGNVPPLVKAVTPEHEATLANLDSEIEKLKQQLAERFAALAPHRQAWSEELKSADTSAEPLAAVTIPLRGDAAARLTARNGEVQADQSSAQPELRDDVFGKVAHFAGKQHLSFSGLNLPVSDRPFSWSVWVKPAGEGAILSKMDSQASARGVDLFLNADGKIAMHVIDAWPSNALKVVAQQPIPRDKWAHVVATYDGSRKAAGVSLYLNGQKQELAVEVDAFTGSFSTAQPFRIGMRSVDHPLHAVVADVQLFQHALAREEAELVFRGALQRGLSDVRVDQLAEPLQATFDELLLSFSKADAVVATADAKRALEKKEAERTSYEAAIPTTMVMEELPQPRATFVLQRGRYDLPDTSQQVAPDTPSVLPAFPSDAPRNRLGLARWVLDRSNPLTARVVVNRLWQQFFGLGLVKSPDNFGVQSEPPSHPELLDWLAVELVESGGNIQHIQRLIVSSGVYQQQSEASPEQYRRDPENRMIARGPRHRLSAEAVRDNALAVSGLLVNKLGGRSVMPYQPEGLWEELAGGAFEVYKQGQGDDLYRRSLYVYRKRTVPHPSLATFDAPSWEFCQVKRATTNTPLQALALLNDVTYIEAARKFAERIIKEGGASADERITFAFRAAVGRSPDTTELAMLRSSLERNEKRFRAAPEAASQFLSHGDAVHDESIDAVQLAAHTAIASIILNMDETVSNN